MEAGSSSILSHISRSSPEDAFGTLQCLWLIHSLEWPLRFPRHGGCPVWWALSPHCAHLNHQGLLEREASELRCLGSPFPPPGSFPGSFQTLKNARASPA